MKYTPFEKALLDNWEGKQVSPLLAESTVSDKEEMPVDIFFREEDEMPDLELAALSKCKGSVLDVGAGAGCHSLVLQERGVPVDALEISRACIEIMLLQGVQNTIFDNLYSFKPEKLYDTILVLMNGIGLAEQLANLNHFLSTLKALLAPEGQIILDSSDLSYAYESPPTNKYYGEVMFRYHYKGELGEWFPWLYVDKATLAKEAEKVGLTQKLLFEDEYDQFLVQLS